MFYEGTHCEFDFFSFLGFCLSERNFSRISCVYLIHAPLISPSSMTTRVVLPHSPIQTSSLTRYEQPVSVTRPCPSMRKAPLHCHACTTIPSQPCVFSGLSHKTSTTAGSASYPRVHRLTASTFQVDAELSLRWYVGPCRAGTRGIRMGL